MRAIERWIRRQFGLPPVIDRDTHNLTLAREWRKRLEERVEMLEAKAEVWLR